jgi:AbrB family looped-hinge helix DNA binding protein
VTTARITSKGQITLPKAIRVRMGVGPGDEVEFVEEDGRYVLKKKVKASPFDEYIGYLKHLEGCDPDEIVRELRGHE